MSQLRSLYDSIDLPTIDEFVRDRRQEDLHLDFKTVGDHIDKRALGKALSGFANSAGGVLVWGVDARKDRSGVDAANSKVPLKNARRCLSELQSFTRDAADPPIDGVEHKSLLEGQDGGYLVSIIPASDSGPHMAKFGEYRYYKRSGDSFYRMEHYDLEDVFGRRPKPVLSLHARPHLQLTQQGARERTFRFTVVFGIENSGRGVAKYPSLTLSFSSPYRRAQYGLDGNGRTGLPIVPSFRADRATIFGGGVDHVVYPGSVLEVTKLDQMEFRFAVGKPATIPNLSVEYRIAAEGVAVLSDKYELTSESILDLIKGHSDA